MECPSKEVLELMPLAEAVMLLWSSITEPERLQTIWNDHLGRCYDDVITFPIMVHLIAESLLQYGGSGRRSLEKNIENGILTATVQAAFQKLGRLPISVSQAFLEECSASLNDAFSPWSRWVGPKSLQEFEIAIFDGKAIKNVAKRLTPLRGRSGGMLGGRALVALDWSTGMVLAMHADADGHANDVKFVPDLLPVVRRRVSGSILFVADRAFTDMHQLQHFTADSGNHYLGRYTKRVKFEQDLTRPPETGADANGRTFVETCGWLGSAGHRLRRYVRRIVLERVGAEDLVLITDLLDSKIYPAEDLLWLYAERWGIERAFQQVTEVFGLQALIGGSPEACIFQFAFCMLLYNMILVIRGYVAQARDLEPEAISTEKLFDDVERQLTAWNVMIEPEQTVEYFKNVPTPSRLQFRLKTLLSLPWSVTWLKSPKQLVHRETSKVHARSHKSVYRLMKEAKQGPPPPVPKAGPKRTKNRNSKAPLPNQRR